MSPYKFFQFKLAEICFIYATDRWSSCWADDKHTYISVKIRPIFLTSNQNLPIELQKYYV